jgi:hypothetical protein
MAVLHVGKAQWHDVKNVAHLLLFAVLSFGRKSLELFVIRLSLGSGRHGWIEVCYGGIEMKKRWIS